MRLDRTSAVLDQIEGSMRDDADRGLIESFLAQYAAVVMYSEMEEKLSDIIRIRLTSYTHQAMAAFVSTTLKDLIRRTQKSDIMKFSARFGDDFKLRFNELVNASEVTLYTNVISARHEIGHRRGSNVTIYEVRQGIAAANHILLSLNDCFDEICGKIDV